MSSLNTTRNQPLIFGTKAETLERFQSRVTTCTVSKLHFFSAADWKADAGKVLRELASIFNDRLLAVRSSAYNEDTASQSLAGAHHSLLNVPGADPAAVQAAVDSVLGSYRSGNPRDQVLVQPMLEQVTLSGVIMTHDLSSGAPYYIINYDDESGKTDVITGGTGVNKTVVIHHDSQLAYIESPRIAQLVEMTRELETLAGDRVPLDIEFAQTADGQLHLLQIRRIAVQKNWNRAVRARLAETLDQLEWFFRERAQPRPSLAGNTTILGQMPDWNPAELIGTQPAPLAVSLFRYLITDDVWQTARARMGYRSVPHESLLVLLAGRPYIDVRNSFNSFLPAGLDLSLENTLIDAWLDRLTAHPEFHDKVEFEVAQTVHDFAFQTNYEARYAEVLGAGERQIYQQRLRALTARNVTPADTGLLARALQVIAGLHADQQTGTPPAAGLHRAQILLAAARERGSLQFAMIARHAFMAEALLRSAVQRGAWSAERLGEFKRSLTTVAGELSQDFARVMAGSLGRADFLRRYGHLRPGTFDIVSPRYDQREDLFRNSQSGAPAFTLAEPFQLQPDEARGFSALLAEAELELTPAALLLYAGRAIAGREYAKFVFTRNVSEALEAIAEWGERLGLARDDLAYLSLPDLFDTLLNPPVRNQESVLHEWAETRRAALRELRSLRLGYIIRDARDLYVVPLHRGLANFVTSRFIERPAVLLDNRMAGPADLFDRIVCIESADPGFDWIFTKGIAGLVTKFGGANSHMTIRCAELGLPAAIGVGEQTFERLTQAGYIELRCGEKIVRPIYAANAS